MALDVLNRAVLRLSNCCCVVDGKLALIYMFSIGLGGKKNSNSNVFLTFQSVLDAKKKTMG